MDGKTSLLGRRHSPRYTSPLDEDNVSVLSWASRPSTQDGARTSCSSSSRLSSDSGAGSIDDFNQRGSSPLPTTFLDYWDGMRRHTAPPRKSPVAQTMDYNRPNTVHTWEVYPCRNTLSRYMPLPAIGTKPEDDPSDHDGVHERRYCFQEDEEVDLQVHDSLEDEEVDLQVHDSLEDESLPPKNGHCEDMIFKKPDRLNVPKLSCGLASLSLESDDDDDSDFDEESEAGVGCPTDEDEEDDESECSQRKRRPIVRSATFTIEDKKKDSDQPVVVVSQRLLLAVRLPDGSRVAGYFDTNDTLKVVCAMAIEKYPNPLDSFELVTTDIPKKVFSDFSVTLSHAGILDKTLLNLQLCDDDDEDSS